MKISPTQNQGAPVDPQSTPTKQVRTEGASTSTSTSTSNSTSAAGNAGDSGTAASNSAATPLQRQTDVTLRRDTNGRVYYVVSDAKSGQEIIEVPPKALRDVSQGIADYLKEEESKGGSHVEVKA